MNAAGYSSFRGGLFNAQHQLPYILFNCNGSTGNTTAKKNGHWVDSTYADGWKDLKLDASRTTGSPQYWT